MSAGVRQGTGSVFAVLFASGLFSIQMQSCYYYYYYYYHYYYYYLSALEM